MKQTSISSTGTSAVKQGSTVKTKLSRAKKGIITTVLYLFVPKRVLNHPHLISRFIFYA